MASTSSSYNRGSSYSTSTPKIIQTPQSDWGLQLSQLLGALGNNQYKWAMDQFNTGMGVTAQNIDNYMQLAGKGAGLAQDLLSRYENVFQPIMDQYIQQAGTYNSEGRQRFMMGQAESTVGQADEQARNEAERKLQGFGINPNSGRYQDLMLTSRIQDAAARAGAGTQASLNTAATGRQMTQTAAQMGQNVPGMTVNALQSAYTGVTGAENAILGMLNTGAALTQSAAPFFNASASANKLPPVANNTVSGSTQNGKSGSMQMDPGGGGGRQQQPQQGGGGRGQGDGGGQRGGGGGLQHAPVQPETLQAPQGPQDPSGQNGWQDFIQQENNMLDSAQNNPEWMGAGTGIGADPGRFDQQIGNGSDTGTGSMWDPNTYNGTYGAMPPSWLIDQANGQPTTTPDTSQPNWDGGQQFGQGQDGAVPADPSSWRTGTYSSPNFDWNSVGNPLAQQQSDNSSFGGDQQQQQDVTGSIQPQGNYQARAQGNYQPQGNYQQGTYGDWQQQGGFDPGNYQPQDSGGNYQSQDNSGGYQPQQQNSGGYDPSNYSGGYYARGGKVQARPSTGGQVPRSASPSRGQQTDDISARLNAGEFVMPRDVVAHKGSEFFQNLIKKSRQARMGISGPPAKPKMKPAMRMRPPSFISRGM